MLLGYGWDNRVEDCRITSSGVGLGLGRIVSLCTRSSYRSSTLHQIH
jgi:hypothetical protein